MLPSKKVKELISKYDNLEVELSSGKIDPKMFAKKSKEYSNLKNIISIAKDYLNFENQKKDLEELVKDKANEKEIIEMAEKDLRDLKLKKENLRK